MGVNLEAYHAIRQELAKKNVTLVAVSKTKPPGDIEALYNEGQRDFGENYVQEMVEKAERLPKDIRWHFIGHLQTNKVKLIAPFVQLIHGVDSLKLLKEINKQAAKQERVIDSLFQVHIAEEDTKFGFDEQELETVMKQVPALALTHVRICGFMGMASFTTDQQQVKNEFSTIRKYFERFPGLTVLSTGMSGDYRIAIDEGSTMVRIGSLLFGERAKQ